MPDTIPKPELVTIAVADLGGASVPVDTEDVAMATHRLAPGAFGWRKYPDQINLELVRVALVDASRAKGEGYVQGSGKHGWVLTDFGVNWMANSGNRLRARLSGSGPRAAVNRPKPRPQATQRSRILRSEVFNAWSGGAPISQTAAASVFRVDQYTPSRTRMLKIRNLQSMFIGDPEVEPFLREMGWLAAPDQD